ncbi:hypothetical protein [Spirosoma agri]|uniref:PKD domain-containing protein n=1 Tax=Spirosoma agri TaxID=1987381 RepID=A0A6M0IIS7_9BACT|nr:hypothetical protein [Spirosoma agri]NEU67757.1 hypothetical protein [Spirosoma agri]
MEKAIVKIPFNGTAVGTGTNPVTAELTGAGFVPGRLDNQAIAFTEGGHADIIPKIVPFNASFSMSIWIKALGQPNGSPSASWLLYKFAGFERFLFIDLNSSLLRWSYLVIIQEFDEPEKGQVSVYLNSRLVGNKTFPADWGNPTGFCIVNDGPAYSGFVNLEEFALYPGVVSDLIQPENPSPVGLLEVEYFINGSKFKDRGIYVSSSDGLFDNLPLKDPQTFDWPDYHGVVMDLSAPRFGARIITLKCFIKSDEGVDEFIERIQQFITQFTKPGTQRLKINAHSTKPLVYEVILQNSINLNKKFRESNMVGTFDLVLMEPDPVKRVLNFVGPGTATITVTSTKVLAIHWGDGTHTYGVFGTKVTATHTYSTAGSYDIILSGVIEDITYFSSNALLVWGKL